MNDLKPCPCGETPDKLHIIGDPGDKWGYVCGDCCDSWIVEYRNGYETEPSAMMALAIEAWNKAQRGDPK